MSQPNHPNVIYIITHDQGIAASSYANFGPCASTKMKTPHLDRLAENGAMLTRHFGTAPQCSPARGSLITGLHPHINGLVGLTHRGFEISPQCLENTIFQQFRRYGYQTRLIGMHHETKYDPRILGYDETSDPHNYEGIMNQVHEFLKQKKEKGNNNQPFWLTIGTGNLHLSWDKKTPEEAWYKPQDVDVPPFLPDTDPVRRYLGKFYSILEEYDGFVGKVLQIVDELDLDKNTIIIHTTDHGIAHPRSKGTLYDPGNHNMMIFSYPKQIKKGKKVHSLLSSIDFAPTICELCNIPPHPNYMGKSYASLLTSDSLEEKTQIQPYIYTEMTYHDVYNPMRSVRSQHFKYIKNYEPEKVSLIDSIPVDIKRTPSYEEWVNLGTNTTRFREEFYDLQKDPLEEHNLLDERGLIKGHIDEENKEYQQKLDELKEKLNEFLVATKDPILNGQYPSPVDANISNAADFDHIPEKKFSAAGVFSKDEGGILMINTAFGMDGTNIIIPIGEILEEFNGESFNLILEENNVGSDTLTIEADNQISFRGVDLGDLLLKSNIQKGDLINFTVGKYPNIDIPTLHFKKVKSLFPSVESGGE